MNLRRLIRILLAWMAVACGSVFAQPYPSRGLTCVVPFPPGGGPDFFGRILAERLPQRLGQPVIVDNRPGVGGLAGANVVAKAAADGHTLLIAPNTIAIAPHILPKGAGGGVNVMSDLMPVIMPASTPMILVVHPDLQVDSVADLVALAKRSKGLAYATAGTGSPMHIGGELFKRAAGVEFFHVPYKGVAASVAAALSGEVKILFTSLGGSVAQHSRAGKLKIIAVTEKRRTPLLGNVPTMAELGYAGVEVDAWYGVFVPAGTPAPVIARLNSEINQVLAIPDVRERLNAAGVDIRGGTPEARGAEMREDYARYGRIVQEFGIKAD
jgi:tripartite-type tricarboxylate transporter receptor subunit TctC